MSFDSEMDSRILFVDDDQMLLSSIERCLGLRYEIDTALSGPEGLRLIEENEEYSVIVTDMRMPIMDGIEFLRRAREVSPHSVYLMLTGNQDLGTAAKAVNEGGVHQLLNKPCDPDQIAASIDLALKRYEQNLRERELFQSTFEGALVIAGDVIEILQPDWSRRIGRAEKIVERLRGDLGIAPNQQYQLAARLAPLGFALIPPAESERYAASLPGAPGHHETLTKAFASSARILNNLPQLSEAAEMIRLAPVSDGAIVESGEDDGVCLRKGAALLRAAYLVDALLEGGVEVEEAKAIIKADLPGASGSFLHAIAEVYPDGNAMDGVKLELEALMPGMVLLKDLRSRTGERLLSAGRRLCGTHIDKLHGVHADPGIEGQIEVTLSSYEAITRGAVEHTGVVGDASS